MVTWLSNNSLELPEFGKHKFKEDFETLMAISQFIGGFAVDLSGTLKYPFPVWTPYDYSKPVTKDTFENVTNQRAKEIIDEYEHITVLCAGDIDSVTVLTALLRNIDDQSRITVRYTAAGKKRYPWLFETYLPNTDVKLDCRDGKPLIGDDNGYYVDGRCGDDWAAGYQASIISRFRDYTDLTNIDSIIEVIFDEYTFDPAIMGLVENGLRRWIDNCPIEIKDGWGFLVALFRFFMVHNDSMMGHITEDDPEHSYEYRIPFYDHVSFTKASLNAIDQGMPDADNDSPEMREYIFDYFKDQNYFDNERPQAVYYIYRLGNLNTRFLANGLQPVPYDKLQDYI